MGSGKGVRMNVNKEVFVKIKKKEIGWRGLSLKGVRWGSGWGSGIMWTKNSSFVKIKKNRLGVSVLCRR